MDVLVCKISIWGARVTETLTFLVSCSTELNLGMLNLEPTFLIILYYFMEVFLLDKRLKLLLMKILRNGKVSSFVQGHTIRNCQSPNTGRALKLHI